MKLTITANTLEEAEFGLGCIKSPAGNYTAKVNQND